MATRSVNKVAVGTTAVKLLDVNTNRRRLLLRNVGSAQVYIGTSNAVSAANGWELHPGGVDFEDLVPATDEVWAISSGTSAVEYMEESGGALAGDQVVTAERTFTETTAAGTYTATVAVPAGATVLDVIWRNTALWTAATSATLNVGDDDDNDGYIAAVDLKSAPAADVNGAGGISTKASSTGTGAMKGAGGRYCAAAKTLTATVVTVGSTGNAGRSRLLVEYSQPVAEAATKA